MTIAFVGNFEVSYCSESHYKKTFEKMGHEVIALQESEVTAETILNAALKSDMLFHVHTHGERWNIPGLAYVYQKLKTEGIPSVGYHLDLWLGIEREKDLDTDPYWDIEYFFSVDKLMVDLMNSRDDLPEAYYLQAGVLEDECYIAEVDEKLAFDVVFTGSKTYHPEWPWRPQLIEWLEKTYGDRFAHFGGGGRPVVRGHKLNQLYASSKVVIGDTLCKDFTYPYYFSDRLFEVPGRGGFLIFPFIKGIEEQFICNGDHSTVDDSGVPGYFSDEGHELVTYPFGDFQRLEELINYFISHDAERESIRRAGHERTKKEHTYTHRLQFILDTIRDEPK